MNGKNLSSHVRRGWIWTSLEMVCQRGLAMLTSLVLARIVGPEAFGLIASVTIFFTISNFLIDGGISQRTVQKTVVTEADYVALFWCNLGMTMLTVVILGMLGPIMARFFHEPQLTWLMPCLALVTFVRNSGRVQMAILLRECCFKRISLIRMTGVIAGALIGLFMAMEGFGVWALIGQNMASACVLAGGLWLARYWRPRGLPSWEAVRDLYGYGLPLVFGQMLQALSANLSNVLIARRFSMGDLGFYNRGQLIPSQVAFSFEGIFTRTCLPTLSRLKEDPIEFQSFFMKMLVKYGGVLALAFSFCMIFSYDLIFILLGDEWRPAGHVLRLASVTWFFWTLYKANYELFRAMGYVQQAFRCNVVMMVFELIGLFIGIRYGVTGILVAEICTRTLGLGIIVGFAHFTGLLRVSYQIKAVSVCLGVTCIAIPLLWPIALLVGNPVMRVGIGAMVILPIALLIFNAEILLERISLKTKEL